MKAISIEVVGNLLTTYSHCSTCEVVFRESGLGEGRLIRGILKNILRS